jgi:hypothetical protein
MLRSSCDPSLSPWFYFLDERNSRDLTWLSSSFLSRPQLAWLLAATANNGHLAAKTRRAPGNESPQFYVHRNKVAVNERWLGAFVPEGEFLLPRRVHAKVGFDIVFGRFCRALCHFARAGAKY